MKSLISILVLIFLSFGFANAQENNSSKWKVNSLTFMTGETPLLKGNSLTVSFSKAKSDFVVDINSELGEFLHFYSGKNFSPGYSAGFYKNFPWAGPVLTMQFFKGHFKTLNWVGWSFGNPEESTTETKPAFLFSYHQFSLVYKWIEGYYTLQHYQKSLPEHLGGMKLTFSLNKNIFIFGGWGYMTRAEKHLWSMGLTYSF